MAADFPQGCATGRGECEFSRRTLLLGAIPAALLGCTATVPQPAVQPGPLPAKVLACYYLAWDTGRYAIGDVPGEFNVIYLFHAKPNGRRVHRSWNNRRARRVLLERAVQPGRGQRLGPCDEGAPVAAAAVTRPG